MKIILVFIILHGPVLRWLFAEENLKLNNSEIFLIFTFKAEEKFVKFLSIQTIFYSQT